MTAMSFQKGTVQSCSEKSILEISEIPSKASSEKNVFFSQHLQRATFSRLRTEFFIL